MKVIIGSLLVLILAILGVGFFSGDWRTVGYIASLALVGLATGVLLAAALDRYNQ